MFIILIYALLSFNLIQVLFNWFKRLNTWNVEYIVEKRFSKEMFIIFFFSFLSVLAYHGHFTSLIRPFSFYPSHFFFYFLLWEAQYWHVMKNFKGFKLIASIWIFSQRLTASFSRKRSSLVLCLHEGVSCGILGQCISPVCEILRVFFSKKALEINVWTALLLPAWWKTDGPKSNITFWSVIIQMNLWTGLGTLVFKWICGQASVLCYSNEYVDRFICLSVYLRLHGWKIDE